MSSVLLFQTEVLKDSWQLETVYKTLKELLKKQDNVLVFDTFISCKNEILNINDSVEVREQLKSLNKVVNDYTKIIQINSKIIEENWKLNKKDICIVIVTGYMNIFDNEILRLEKNKTNIRRVIKATKELYKNVIIKELNIKEEKTKKKELSIWEKIKRFFK